MFWLAFGRPWQRETTAVAAVLLQSSRLNQTMMEMSREMMRAGIIDEMMADAVDGAVDTEDMEEETEEEVDKVCIFKYPCCLHLEAAPVSCELAAWAHHVMPGVLGVSIPGICQLAACECRFKGVGVRLQVLMEIAGETMSQMAAAPQQRREQPAAVAAEEEEEAGLQDDLRARLEAVRS